MYTSKDPKDTLINKEAKTSKESDNYTEEVMATVNTVKNFEGGEDDDYGLAKPGGGRRGKNAFSRSGRSGRSEQVDDEPNTDEDGEQESHV